MYLISHVSEMNIYLLSYLPTVCLEDWKSVISFSCSLWAWHIHRQRSPVIPESIFSKMFQTPDHFLGGWHTSCLMSRSNGIYFTTTISMMCACRVTSACILRDLFTIFTFLQRFVLWFVLYLVMYVSRISFTLRLIVYSSGSPDIQPLVEIHYGIPMRFHGIK